MEKSLTHFDVSKAFIQVLIIGKLVAYLLVLPRNLAQGAYFVSQGFNFFFSMNIVYLALWSSLALLPFVSLLAEGMTGEQKQKPVVSINSLRALRWPCIGAFVFLEAWGDVFSNGALLVGDIANKQPIFAEPLWSVKGTFSLFIYTLLRCSIGLALMTYPSWFSLLRRSKNAT